jgi:putative solute:sodium symporter small subunit
MSDNQQREAHWNKTRNLMIIHLVIWFVFAFVVHWFAKDLNSASFIGFPLGYYMASQGSLLAFVIQLFVFVKQQDNIDRQFGMAEDDDA